jgi:hypothetical protein
MKSLTVSSLAAIALLVSLVIAGSHRALEPDGAALAAASAAVAASMPTTNAGSQGFLYGRVTSEGGTTYEGRLRFGGGEEAFWGDYFNGFKRDNPWAGHAPRERATRKRPFELFGLRIAFGEEDSDLGRPLMARFGDIARLEAHGRALLVTLKSGTGVQLDRFAADDFADGLRIWDVRRGVVDLDEWRVRSIEFLQAGPLQATPARLHGTVRTRHGAFTGFIQWDRAQGVGSDDLVGRTADGELTLSFDAIRSIARRSSSSALATLVDGREIVLSDTRQVGRGHRGIYVDDRRYGRVLVSWDAFERIDFSAADSGPAYADFPAGRALTGSVTTRAGRRLTGRLVYDLDESETTETLDAPSEGVDYTIPFGLIASISLADGEAPGARLATVTLHDREEMSLERSGDLGDGNAGILIFINGREHPEFVPWTDVQQIAFDRPPLMYPPLAGR